MKRLVIVAVTAVLGWSALLKAEGPDEQYIEIYKLIQDGDQLAATGQLPSARAKYAEAQAELKKLQVAYPKWNEKLVVYRLRNLEGKLAGGAPALRPAVLPENPAPAPGKTQPAAAAPPATATAPAAAIPQGAQELETRDNQIKVLQAQIGQLQSDKSVLEAKLREALSARPASVDPRELARAEERIRALEKDKEVLRVSLQVAEARMPQKPDARAAESAKALADANLRLKDQSEAIAALRLEKDLLEKRVQAAKRSQDDAVKALRDENANLTKQLAGRAPATQAPGTDQAADKELASTKAALQSSRDTVASLQVRLRTLQEERDRLDKTRKELEAKLALNAATAVANSSDSAQVKDLRRERDDLQKKLNDTLRQMADIRSKSKSAASRQPAEDVSGLRARLDVLEARKVPYTPEELAFFKKPQEVVAFTRPAADKKPPKELPQSAAPLLAEAQRAFTARRFDEAEKKYLEVLRLDDRNVATLQRLAATQLEQNRPKDAETSLKQALQQDAGDARSLLLMGIAKFDLDKFDEALDSLSRSAQADPQNAETQNYLGITLSQKGQRGAAETALRKAIQLSPGYSSAHYNLAVVYATQQPPFTELARWHYQKALAYGHAANPDFEKLLERKQAASQKQ